VTSRLGLVGGGKPSAFRRGDGEADPIKAGLQPPSRGLRQADGAHILPAAVTCRTNDSR